MFFLVTNAEVFFISFPSNSCFLEEKEACVICFKMGVEKDNIIAFDEKSIIMFW